MNWIWKETADNIDAALRMCNTTAKLKTTRMMKWMSLEMDMEMCAFGLFPDARRPCCVKRLDMANYAFRHYNIPLLHGKQDKIHNHRRNSLPIHTVF